MTRYETAQLVIQALAAIGALAVALMALFGDWIRATFLGPKLSLSLVSNEGILVKSPGRHCRMYHMLVQNHRRWAVAKSVRVLVKQIGKTRVPGGPIVFHNKLPGGVQILWQFSDFTSVAPDIGPERLCDLAFIDQGGDCLLSEYNSVIDFPGFVSRGEEMAIQLVAEAVNAHSAPLNICIQFYGNWHENDKEMSRNIVIRELPELPKPDRQMEDCE